MPAKRNDLDPDHIVRLYLSGLSAAAVGRETGCSAFTVNHILRSTQTPIRDKSAAGVIRAARETPEFKARKAALVRAKALGRPMSAAALERRALGMEKGLSQRIGVHEAEMAHVLASQGLHVRRQVACGRYNLDLAADNVAVEIHTHPHGPHLNRFGLHERVDHLTDNGWRVLYVWCPTGISSTESEQVVRLVQEMGGEPATPGQYRMFRCHGDHRPARGGYAYQGAYVVTTSGAVNRPRDHDRRVRGNA